MTKEFNKKYYHYIKVLNNLYGKRAHIRKEFDLAAYLKATGGANQWNTFRPFSKYRKELLLDESFSKHEVIALYQPLDVFVTSAGAILLFQPHNDFIFNFVLSLNPKKELLEWHTLLLYRNDHGISDCLKWVKNFEQFEIDSEEIEEKVGFTLK